MIGVGGPQRCCKLDSWHGWRMEGRVAPSCWPACLLQSDPFLMMALSKVIRTNWVRSPPVPPAFLRWQHVLVMTVSGKSAENVHSTELCYKPGSLWLQQWGSTHTPVAMWGFNWTKHSQNGTRCTCLKNWKQHVNHGQKYATTCQPCEVRVWATGERLALATAFK